MRVFYSVSAVFDDSNLVSTAGLALALALADRAGLHEVIGEHLSVPGSAGSNATVKVAALVAGMVWHWLTRRSVTRSRPSTPRCGRASLRVAPSCAPSSASMWPMRYCHYRTSPPVSCLSGSVPTACWWPGDDRGGRSRARYVRLGDRYRWTDK